MTKRMTGPDIIKIMATVFVIFIHHRVKNTAYFSHQYMIMMLGWFVLALAVSICIFMFFRKKDWDTKKLFLACASPIIAFISICCLRKYAVTFFFVVSGYMLSKSLSKQENVIKSWYESGKLFRKIARFYLTLVPVVIIGVAVQMLFQGYEYTLSKILKLFLLGGFTPGSYYVVVMAQFVLIFPFLYLPIKKYREWGLLLIIIITLSWDILSPFVFHLSRDAYKFCGVRLLTSIAVGIYAHETKDNKKLWVYLTMFIVGLVYLIVFPVYKLLPMPLFYQWQSASLFVALFLCLPVSWFISVMEKVPYNHTRISRISIELSNATYHIFLVQMLYFRLFGYNFNAWVDNIIITMPVNMIVSIGFGYLYYKLYSPIENKVLKTKS